jgi:hypothetical protein
VRLAIAFVCLAVAGSLVLGPAPARAAEGWVVCQARGSVYLHTDESKTTLVDAFAFADAPTKHRVGSSDYVIQGDGAAPGVDVVGVVTGTPYVFEFRSVTAASGPTPGDVIANVNWMDWRVTAAGAGIVADARTRWLGIYREDEPIVVEMVGPVHQGLHLSGGMSITCPQS